MDHQIYYMFLFGNFAAIMYMTYVDSNVAKYIVLLYKLTWINLSRFIFWLKLYPRIYFETIILKWKSKKILKNRTKPPSQDKNDVSPPPRP